MSSSMMKTLNILISLLLAIISHVLSAPTLVSETIFDQVLNHTTRDTSATLSPRDNNWVPGEPVKVWISSAGRAIYYKTCEPNKTDQYMCTVTFAQNTEKDWAIMWLYDNQCNQIGYNGQVSRAELADRYSMASKLPNCVDVNIDRSWNPTWNSGVQVWYGASYNREPWLWAPQQWLPQLNKDVIEGNDSGRPWFIFRVPFLCA